MKKKYLFAAGFMGLCFASFALTGYSASSNDSQEPILFQAKFSSDNVMHQLFKPNSPDVPHPFYANLCKANPAPVDYSKAIGEAIFSFDPKTHTLKYAIAYDGLSGNPIMAHFHFASSKEEGPIVQTICGQPPKNSDALGFSAKQLDGQSCPQSTAGFITGSYTLKGNPKLKMTEQQEIQALMDGKLYINFHTCLNELGEIRGQLMKMS